VDGTAIEGDLPGVGRGQAVHHVHQRGLAGPVLAQQRVDLAPLDRQVDPVVRPQGTVGLDDAAELER
jgi:hypothetical protein